MARQRPCHSFFTLPSTGTWLRATISVRPLHVLFADDLALAVEPHYLILRLEDRVVILVHVFVGAGRRNDSELPAWAFTRWIAQKLAHHFVGIAHLDLGHALSQFNVVMVGPHKSSDDCERNNEEDDSGNHERSFKFPASSFKSQTQSSVPITILSSRAQRGICLSPLAAETILSLKTRNSKPS